MSLLDLLTFIRYFDSMILWRIVLRSADGSRTFSLQAFVVPRHG
jgi:hypothetical protein